MKFYIDFYCSESVFVSFVTYSRQKAQKIQFFGRSHVNFYFFFLQVFSIFLLDPRFCHRCFGIEKYNVLTRYCIRRENTVTNRSVSFHYYSPKQGARQGKPSKGKSTGFSLFPSCALISYLVEINICSIELQKFEHFENR